MPLTILGPKKPGARPREDPRSARHATAKAPKPEGLDADRQFRLVALTPANMYAWKKIELTCPIGKEYRSFCRIFPAS